MCDKPRRVRQSIDYKIFNDSGRKVEKQNIDVEVENIVEKFENLSVMDTKKLLNEEKKINLKLVRTLNEYELETLYEINDIEAGISEIKKLIESYEEVVVELREELGREYNNTVFETQLKIVMEWIKNARLEIKNRKISEEDMREELRRKEIEKKENQFRKERNQLLNEEKHLRLRIDQEIENMPLKTPSKNIHRSVGRNDSCPCGSGKKFKKCWHTYAKHVLFRSSRHGDWCFYWYVSIRWYCRFWRKL